MTEQKQQPAFPSPDDVEIIVPFQIISEVYRSLDRQIAKLDEIPDNALAATQRLLNIVLEDPVYSDSIFTKKKAVFVEALLNTSEQVGHAFHTILEIMREQGRPEQPSDIQMPSLPIVQGQKLSEQANPSTIVQTQQPKGAFGSGFFDWLQVRRYAKTIEKYMEAQKDMKQAQITSTKVVDILDYGRQLEAEWMRLLDFYDKAIKRLSFFNDKDTYRNQHEEIENHIIKMSSIIRAFSRTIVEFRKERFGDRKVGVAAGAMWLEGMKAQQNTIAGRFGGTIPTSGGGVSEMPSIIRKPKGGPYPPTLSSGVGAQGAGAQSHE